MVRFIILLIVFVLFRSAHGEAPVSFRRDLAPLLHRRCARCHQEDSAKGHYRLDSFAQMTRAGESDLPPIVPANPEESELFRRLIEPDADDRMPQKADSLPPPEIALVERWIREGASYDGDAPERPLVELARESFLRLAPERYARPPPITALAFSPDSTQLAVSGYYELTIWNLVDGSLSHRVSGLPERITAIVWHPLRNLLAVAGGSPAQWGAVALVDPATGFQVRYLCDLAESALSVSFSPDGALLATGAGDRTIRIFATGTGKLERTLRQHADWVQSVAYSPNGKLLVSASRDRTARVFNAATGELEATFTGHDAPLLAASFLTDETIVSLARGRSVKAWDAAKAERKSELALSADVQQMASSPSGVITAGSDGQVRVHQISDGRELFTLRGHSDVVQALAIAPSGEVLASGSADGTVCVWSLVCGTWVQRFTAEAAAYGTRGGR